MAMKESNKDRAKRLAKEKETRNRALDNMVQNAEELGLYTAPQTIEEEQTQNETWVSDDAFPHQSLNPKHLKWIALGVGVASVALFFV